MYKIVPKNGAPPLVVKLCINVFFSRYPSVLRACECGTVCGRQAMQRAENPQYYEYTTNQFPSTKIGGGPAFFGGKLLNIKICIGRAFIE